MGSPAMNIVPARLEAGERGLVAVVDDLRLPLPHVGDALRTRLGSPVLLGLRPEAIADPGRRFEEAGGLTAHLTAPVEMLEPTGAETMILARFGGVEVQAKADAGYRPAVGSRADFTLDLRKACLFDPATERALV
jgi:multiple sugar transport system ATP-binding protein